MRIHPILPCAIAGLLAGCASDMSIRRYDNPAIRTLQEEETARHLGADTDRTGLKREIGLRVSRLLPGVAEEAVGTSVEGGRAVALTADGYFLTAFHVVDDGPCFIEETRRIGRLSGTIGPGQLDRHVRVERHAGRLVWSDPRIDLAILKFPLGERPHFDKLKVPPRRGEVVFTSDDEGRMVMPVREDGRSVLSLKDAIGNGAFFAAGEIADDARRNRAARSFEYPTTLVARGGMSGAPLVTADGELCGIIQSVQWRWLKGSHRTVASMIEPEFLAEIIGNDRRKHGDREKAEAALRR